MQIAGVVHDKTQNSPTLTWPCTFSALAAFHIKKRLMQLQKGGAKGDEFLPRRSVARISLIGIRIFRISHDRLL